MICWLGRHRQQTIHRPRSEKKATGTKSLQQEVLPDFLHSKIHPFVLMLALPISFSNVTNLMSKNDSQQSDKVTSFVSQTRLQQTVFGTKEKIIINAPTWQWQQRHWCLWNQGRQAVPWGWIKAHHYWSYMNELIWRAPEMHKTQQIEASGIVCWEYRRTRGYKPTSYHKIKPYEWEN